MATISALAMPLLLVVVAVSPSYGMKSINMKWASCFCDSTILTDSDMTDSDIPDSNRHIIQDSSIGGEGFVRCKHCLEMEDMYSSCASNAPTSLAPLQGGSSSHPPCCDPAAGTSPEPSPRASSPRCNLPDARPKPASPRLSSTPPLPSQSSTDHPRVAFALPTSSTITPSVTPGPAQPPPPSPHQAPPTNSDGATPDPALSSSSSFPSITSSDTSPPATPASSSRRFSNPWSGIGSWAGSMSKPRQGSIIAPRGPDQPNLSGSAPRPIRMSPLHKPAWLATGKQKAAAPLSDQDQETLPWDSIMKKHDFSRISFEVADGISDGLRKLLPTLWRMLKPFYAANLNENASNLGRQSGDRMYVNSLRRQSDSGLNAIDFLRRIKSPLDQFFRTGKVPKKIYKNMNTWIFNLEDLQRYTSRFMQAAPPFSHPRENLYLNHYLKEFDAFVKDVGAICDRWNEAKQGSDELRVSCTGVFRDLDSLVSMVCDLCNKAQHVQKGTSMLEVYLYATRMPPTLLKISEVLESRWSS